MSMFTLVILFDHFQFTLIHGPNIPGSCAILLFTASDLASITSHIHNWVLFFLWLYPFILSEVISPLISSSILGTYQPGEFIFQCPIFLPFHTFHGVLKSRILKWCALPFSSGSHSVRPLHRDWSILGGTSPQSKNKTYNCIKVSMWRLVADLFITLNWKLLNASLKKKFIGVELICSVVLISGL